MLTQTGGEVINKYHILLKIISILKLFSIDSMFIELNKKDQ